MQKNTHIGIIVAVLIIGAYLVGQGSSNTPQTPAVKIADTKQAEQTQPQAVVEVEQKDYAPSPSNLVKESTDGLNCKTVANAAAQNNQTRNAQTTYVAQSHFSKAYNNCYYELSINTTDGSVSTEIHVTPDDNWLAQCSSGIYPAPQLFCTQHNVGQLTEQQFRQLESQYFAN